MKKKFRFFRASLVAPVPVIALVLGCVAFVMHDPASGEASLRLANMMLWPVAPVLYALMTVVGYVGTRVLALLRALSLLVLVALAVAVGLVFGGAAAFNGTIGRYDMLFTFAVIGGAAVAALVSSSLLWWWVATRGVKPAVATEVEAG